jgi:hypothetical protein
LVKRRTKIGTILKRKATNSAKQTIYQALWRENVPGKYKKN